jgi:alpha-galactosidase
MADDNAVVDGSAVRVDAGGWGLTWAADDAGCLRQVGLGPEGATAQLGEIPLALFPDAYPTYGGGDALRPPALRITHADGSLTTRLVVEHVSRMVEPGGEHVTMRCRDERFHLHVEHHLRTHPASGVLEQWVEILHEEPGTVRLMSYDSMSPLLLASPDAEVVQFVGGGWADEWRWNEEGLSPGTKSLASFGGVQPHLQAAPMLLLSPSGPGSERSGDSLGCSIQWGGNTRFDLDVRPKGDLAAPSELRLRCGANPLGAEYLLDPGVRFVAPAVAWTWATTGRAEVTRRFHIWTRERVLRDPNRVRPVVANNWEATFFDFDEARILDLIDQSGELGAEVFLLDDGWFGTNHPRDDDTAGLGDWDVDRAKLPNGLAPLADAAAARGLRFGIWVEPEMVNPLSELYVDHPDWVVRDSREPAEHRNQLVLDPLIDEVREFEASVVDRALCDPGISYVKWDANRPITDPGSTQLAPDRQANLWVDQVHATWAVMDEVVRRHPEVELMLCASGGGRTDHATLRRFHEFWTSDNTDPVTRVRMQWACSHFFPAAAMAAHVTRWGGRPIHFGCAVALSGRFGLDLDLLALSSDEWAACRSAVALAKRTQRLVQQGRLVRLVSPMDRADRSRAALACIDPGSDETVLFAYQLEASNRPGPSLMLDWLDPDATYTVTETDLAVAGGAAVTQRSGRELIDGLDWQLTEPETAKVWEITPVRG